MTSLLNPQKNPLNFKCYEMLNKESFVDVTIVADGRFMQAHKIVLAAASGYFEEIFSILQDKHPAIVIKDITYKQLQHMMQYVYCGSVDIETSEMLEFTKLLDSMKIEYEQSDEMDDDDEAVKEEHDDESCEPEFIEPEGYHDIIDCEEPTWNDVPIKKEPYEAQNIPSTLDAWQSKNQPTEISTSMATSTSNHTDTWQSKNQPTEISTAAPSTSSKFVTNLRQLAAQHVHRRYIPPHKPQEIHPIKSS